MSLYNMFCGVNDSADSILNILNLTKDDIDRFRDVTIKENEIVIFARTGGGNREDYPQEKLINHPNYLRDEDDDFDSTYAYFYFSIPKDANIEDKDGKQHFGVDAILKKIEDLKGERNND